MQMIRMDDDAAADALHMTNEATSAVSPIVSTNGSGNGYLGDVNWKRVGRNDPCPCGSGKKFKSCHYASLRAEGVI